MAALGLLNLNPAGPACAWRILKILYRLDCQVGLSLFVCHLSLCLCALAGVYM
jgi:hypothetical protein